MGDYTATRTTTTTTTTCTEAIISGSNNDTRRATTMTTEPPISIREEDGDQEHRPAEQCRTYLLTRAARLDLEATTTNEVTPLPPSLLESASPAVQDGGTFNPVVATTPSSSTTTSSNNNNSNNNSNRKKSVPHVYRDFSSVTDTTGYVRKKTGGVTQPFPEKLHEMLDQEEEERIVGWLPHGRAFLVRKPKEFTEIVMPKFFRQTKLTSFQRQLNLYGFRRLTQGPDAGAYYHELFLRGRPHLCTRMQRQKVKGTGHKQPADAKTEPNFYAMAPSEASPVLRPRTPSPIPPSVAQNTSGDSVPPISESSFLEMSPGRQVLHSAANLLKNFAASVPSNTKGMAKSPPLPDIPTMTKPSSSSTALQQQRRRQGDDSTQSTTTTSTATTMTLAAPFQSHATSSKEEQVQDQPLPPPSSSSTTTSTTTITPSRVPTVSPSRGSTMSLLGRVNLTASSSSSSPSPSFPALLAAAPVKTFVWPPAAPLQSNSSTNKSMEYSSGPHQTAKANGDKTKEH